MRTATPQLRDLARRLFAREAEKHNRPSDAAETMEQVCIRLLQRLNPLIGAGGFHALLTRALHLAKAEFSWLSVVKIEQHPGCSFKGLRESIEGRETTAANDGFSAMTANIIWLLVTFLGEDLIFGLVDEAWPGIRTGEADSGS